jgi:hypothetical protein
MKKLINFVIDSKVIYVLTGLLLSLGIIILVADLTWVQFPAAFPTGSLFPGKCDGLVRIAFWCLGCGFLCSLAALVQLLYTKPTANDVNYSKVMFGQCLCGIGFVLLLDALVNVVAISGFAKAGALAYLFESGTYSTTNVLRTTNAPIGYMFNELKSPSAGQVSNTVPILITSAQTATNRVETVTNGVGSLAFTKDSPCLAALDPYQANLVKAIQLLFALGFTIMGALFFFAKSLWVKMQSTPIIQFDERIFWAGLWFRLGEAVVFTVVVFLALFYEHFSEGLSWMPFISLIIGISVKAAENLIAGITERVLDSVKALVCK